MRKLWGWLILIAAILGFMLFWGADFITELIWYENLGYLAAFLTLLKLRLVPGFISFLVIFAFLSLNWLFVQKSWEKDRIKKGADPIRISRYFIIIVSLLIAIAFNSNLFIKWQDVVGFLGRTPFDLKDPLFNHDISFYIFTLPLIESVYQTLFGMIIITALAALIFYLITGNIHLLNRHLKMNNEARFHLLLLVLLSTLLGVLGWQLKCYKLLNSPAGIVYGATYSDVYGRLLFYRIMQILSAVAVLVFTVNLFRNTYKSTLVVLVVLLGVGLFGQLIPSFIQSYLVEPNELTKEKQFIENNIRFTRYAFNLDNIKATQFNPATSFSADDWEDNVAVLENVRLWDWRALEKTFAQLQELRYYYQMGEIDVDRYNIEGTTRQVAIATREISSDRLTESANTWVNRHLVFTHGYGVVISSMHDVTEQGLPGLIVRDIPPKGFITIDRPEIYFGEKTTDYVIVNTRQKELDYPSGEDNVLTSYAGEGGIALNSFLRKLLYSLRFKTTKIILSSDIGKKAKIMYYRQIKDRVAKLVPFLKLDPDPYAVAANGRIYWLLDAYTVSDRFPYSQPISGVGNYMRGSFKIVMDAYTGKTDIYLYDNKDPLGQAYQKIFPSLIKNKEEFPQELIPHLRYPEQLFIAQAHILELYHMTNPDVFFNKEDIWEFPAELYHGQSIYMEPYYAMVHFPMERQAEFVLMLPFTPKNKHNMVSWLAGRSDSKQYGELVLYRFPKDRIIYGPMQIEARINQDPEISKLLSLWNQQGSSVQRGNHLVLPMNDSLLYVEPIYLLADQGQIPELRLVVLSDGTELVYGSTFSEAYNKLRKEQVTPVVTPLAETNTTSDEKDKLAELAFEAFLEAEEALRSGPNWQAYAAAQKKLKDLLEKMNKPD